MFVGENIAKFGQDAPRILSAVRGIEAVMQMDFNFTPAAMAEVRQLLKVIPVILLGGIKIRVYERPPFVVTPAADRPGIVFAPTFHTAFLFVVGREGAAIFGNNSGFEMVGKRQDKVQSSGGNTPGKTLEGIAWKPSQQVRNLLRGPAMVLTAFWRFERRDCFCGAMIVGLAGLTSGPGLIAERFNSEGFAFHSLSPGMCKLANRLDNGHFARNDTPRPGSRKHYEDNTGQQTPVYRRNSPAGYWQDLQRVLEHPPRLVGSPEVAREGPKLLGSIRFQSGDWAAKSAG